MVESKPTSDKQYLNAERINTAQPYVSSVGTSTSDMVDRIKDTNQSVIGQATTGSAGTTMRAEVPKAVTSPTMTPKTETPPANGGINPVLGRALIGGLVGATWVFRI